MLPRGRENGRHYTAQDVPLPMLRLIQYEMVGAHCDLTCADTIMLLWFAVDDDLVSNTSVLSDANSKRRAADLFRAIVVLSVEDI